MGDLLDLSGSELEKFYLEAARHTYAGGITPSTLAELPGSKALRYQRGDFGYVDVWFSDRSGRSYGQTTIWFKGVPVWGMQYHGSCDGEKGKVVPFLKRALMAAYAKGEFIGGRGPRSYAEGLMKYTNAPGRGDFAYFKGEEWIREEGKLLFWHGYWGMAL